MKTIVTKYHGPSNVKGARMSANVEGQRKYYPYSHELDAETNHEVAARLMRTEMKWKGAMVGGGLPDQSGMAWVFTKDSPSI